ncbi:MAG: hypothetical protein OEQ29_17415 [Alphaproteobacteria bacterium]|nr:hypothetical protein [Alphaproteobacteria bacterium]
MKRLILIICTALLAAPTAQAAANLTEWTPVCICKSGHPERGDRITAIFRITDDNKAAMRRKISQGRLGLGQYATLRGGACDQPKLCGRSYDFKSKTYYPNTPIAGPVTVRINMLMNAPAKRDKGSRVYRLNPKWFRVGHNFKVGGKPTSRDAAKAAIESANRVTVWRPICICRSGHPDRQDRITAIFRITDANKAAMRRKMRDGRLGLRQTARLVGGACDQPRMCGTTRDYKTKERFPNTPIAGPVTIRINMLLNAPVKRPRGAQEYQLVEDRFRVGKRFTIGGKSQ